MNNDWPYNVFHGVAQPWKFETRACNCIGPQRGEPRCPCQMPAYREERAGREALAILRKMTVKPRVRVKAISVNG